MIECVRAGLFRFRLCDNNKLSILPNMPETRQHLAFVLDPISTVEAKTLSYEFNAFVIG